MDLVHKLLFLVVDDVVHRAAVQDLAVLAFARAGLRVVRVRAADEVAGPDDPVEACVGGRGVRVQSVFLDVGGWVQDGGVAGEDEGEEQCEC